MKTEFQILAILIGAALVSSWLRLVAINNDNDGGKGNGKGISGSSSTSAARPKTNAEFHGIMALR